MALDQQQNWNISMAENLAAIKAKAAQTQEDEPQNWMPKACTGPPVHLPDEILINILEYVQSYKEFQRTLASCCLLSHQWYNAAVPYLYDRPQLYGKNFEPFARTICPSINLHVRKSPLSNLIRELDLGGLVHQASRSITARLLGRTKANLEYLRAPQASFAINCLPALARCTKLQSLDLSLVSESPPLPALLRSVSHLDHLRSFRLPRSAGFGLYNGQDACSWPVRLQSLAISGGIDAWFLAGAVKFPDTLHDLTIEHCPSARSVLVINFLVNSARKLPLLESIKISHMPRFGPQTMDDLLSILPHIRRLSIAVDYITAALFDDGSPYKSVLNDALEREGSPILPKLHHDRLHTLELTNSGTQGIEDKITPIDILIAIDNDCLPALRVVKVAKSLFWQSGDTAREVEALDDALKARNKADWEGRQGGYATMSAEQWKKAEPIRLSGVCIRLFTGCTHNASFRMSTHESSPIEEPVSAELQQNVQDHTPNNTEHVAAVQAQGWAEPVPFDYNLDEGAAIEWAATGARYEWQDEYGEVAPRLEELEAQLFTNEYRMRAGDSFEALAEFQCDVQGPERLDPIRSFADAGLHPVMLENLQLCGYIQPTPIQSYCIPYGLQDHDMVAVAQTGSGKTAAYMIPIISKLMGKAQRLAGPRPSTTTPDASARTHRVRAEPLVVVVVPARELAIQTFDEARRMCYRSMLRPCVTYGGLPMRDSVDDLGKGCDVLIATPGRLADLMDRPDILSMRRVKYTIIDEADELLAADWDEQLSKIMSGGDTNVDADHTFLMFSATFPQRAAELAAEYLEEGFTKVCIGRSGSTHRNITQDVIWVDRDRKLDALWDFIMTLTPCRILIFCNTRRTVDIVDDFLFNRGLPVTSLHSQRNQRERESTLRAFRSGCTPICIATGVSSRGWDIAGIEHVVNYDMSSQMYGGIDEYVHRIGRTGRIGHTGRATTFFNERDEELGPQLANILLEAGMPVPEFLQQHVAADGAAHFDEQEQTTEGAAPAWGGGAQDENAVATWATAAETAPILDAMDNVHI